MLTRGAPMKRVPFKSKAPERREAKQVQYVARPREVAQAVAELPPAAPGDGSLTANFGAAPPFATPPYTATFTDTSGTTGAAITGWAWTFGDGGTSSLQNPTHDYPGPGTYHVTLTVSHATDSDTAETDIVIP